MTKSKSVSAGLLLYRFVDGSIEVLIGHMGGPFWARKDAGAWSIPKGELDEGEDPLVAARREFEEETGSPAPSGPALPLGEVRQASGKRVIAWAIEGDLDPRTVKSNTFVMEWPPKSGRQAEFPEIDRVAWVNVATASEKLVRGQSRFLEVLEEKAAGAPRPR